MDLYIPAPPKPEQYLHLYVDAMMTNIAWDRGRPPQTWMFPDVNGQADPCPPNEYRGASCDAENIPLELIRIATSRCPFLGAQVELMFKELGIYEADSPQSTK